MLKWMHSRKTKAGCFDDVCAFLICHHTVQSASDLQTSHLKRTLYVCSIMINDLSYYIAAHTLSTYLALLRLCDNLGRRDNFM